MRMIFGLLILVVCIALTAARGAMGPPPALAAGAQGSGEPHSAEAESRRRFHSAAITSRMLVSIAQMLGGMRVPIVLDGRGSQTLFDPDR
jgi:hypothetical protein